MEDQFFCSAIIVAAGQGKRTGLSTNKIFYELAGIPVLAHTLLAFEDCCLISEIVIVGRKDEFSSILDIIHHFHIQKFTHLVSGGKERQDSVKNGLARVSKKCSVVAIHDGARPFVSKASLDNVIRKGAACGAAALAVRCRDTVKLCRDDQTVVKTVPRQNLWLIQTPQVFSKDLIMDAYLHLKDELVTDDCCAVERLGISPIMVENDGQNLKITTKEDLKYASWLAACHFQYD